MMGRLGKDVACGCFNHRTDAARQFHAPLQFAVRVVICLYLTTRYVSRPVPPQLTYSLLCPWLPISISSMRSTSYAPKPAACAVWYAADARMSVYENSARDRGRR